MMVLTKEQLQLIDSCPPLSALKEWIIAVDESITPEDEDDLEPEPTSYDVTITVDDGSDGISGASVVIGETTKTTGDTGECTFNDLTEGEKSVTITKEGFIEKTETIDVDSNHTSFTISLTTAQQEDVPGEP